MPTPPDRVDGRALAWLSAWQLLDAAKKARAEDPPPSWYYPLVTEAQVYAQLASAQQSVGMAAGTLLRAQQASMLNDEERQQVQGIIETAMGRDPAMSGA